MSDDETIFTWSDPDLAETLAAVLLVEDAEAANVTLSRDVGDISFVVLRIRTKTKEQVAGELALALTPLQASTVADVLKRLAVVGDATERRN